MLDPRAFLINSKTGRVVAATFIEFLSGNSTNPSICFTDSPDSGLQCDNSGAVNYVKNGINLGELGTASSLIGGSDTQIQFNNSGSFDGSADLTWDNTGKELSVGGNLTAASFIPTSSTVPTNGVYLPAANSVAISTNGSGRLFVDASGNFGFGTPSPVVACDVVGQVRASTGILFGSDTAETNALDDYEEGNWTPGNLDPDLTVPVARYIKIGRLVHAWFVTTNANTVATYDLPSNVQGLPFVRKMTGGYSNYGLLAGTVSVINNITYSGSQIVWNGVVVGRFNDPDGCNIRWKNDTTESAPNLQPQIVNAPAGGLYFDFHVVYEALS